MTSPRRPAKGPDRTRKPTKAELDGIRTRSAAAHGGTALSEANILQTWKNNVGRQALKKAQKGKAAQGKVRGRGAVRGGAKIGGKEAIRAKRGAASSTTSESPKKRGNTKIGNLPGRSALAPGRKRGNPTPGKRPITPGPRPNRTGPGASRPSTTINPKSALKAVGRVMPRPVEANPKLGFSEKVPTTRQPLSSGVAKRKKRPA